MKAWHQHGGRAVQRQNGQRLESAAGRGRHGRLKNARRKAGGEGGVMKMKTRGGQCKTRKLPSGINAQLRRARNGGASASLALFV